MSENSDSEILKHLYKISKLVVNWQDFSWPLYYLEISSPGSASVSVQTSRIVTWEIQTPKGRIQFFLIVPQFGVLKEDIHTNLVQRINAQNQCQESWILLRFSILGLYMAILSVCSWRILSVCISVLYFFYRYWSYLIASPTNDLLNLIASLWHCL